MRVDLEDAYAAIDWAVAQLPALEKARESWIETPPYLLIEELHPEMGQKLFKLEINRRLPAPFNAGVGAVINSVRTSLDLLASALATRNGKSPSSERHFPIYASIDFFLNEKNAAKRKKWLSAIDLQIIEGLKPYKGGNDLLFALHRLDITRKHERLIAVELMPSKATINAEAHDQGLRFPTIWPGFKHGSVIAWTDIGATNTDFKITADIAFNETGLLVNEPLIATLRQFAGLANSIIQLFEET